MGPYIRSFPSAEIRRNPVSVTEAVLNEIWLEWLFPLLRGSGCASCGDEMSGSGLTDGGSADFPVSSED